MKARLCGWACAMSAVALLFAGVLSVSAQAQTVYSQSVCDDVDDVIQPLFNILKAFSMVEGSLIYKSEAGPFGTTHPSETIHWQLTFGPNLEVYSICGYSTVRIGPSARVWSSDQGPVSGGMRLQAGMSINASQTCLTNWSFREFNIPGLSDLLDAVGTLVHADISTTVLVLLSLLPALAMMHCCTVAARARAQVAGPLARAKSSFAAETQATPMRLRQRSTGEPST